MSFFTHLVKYQTIIYLTMKQLSFLGILLLLSFSGFAQIARPDSTIKLLTIDELFALAEQHSKTLAISRQDMAISKQQTDITKSKRLPELGASLSGGFISNASVWDNKLKNRETVSMPHISESLELEANQIIYQGNKLSHTIEKAALAEQLASLSYVQDRENIRFLLLGKYFDLFKLLNHQKVYLQNIRLAQQRLENIRKFKQEGMVTQNDIIRSELQLTNLQLALDAVDDDIIITNHELCVVLGLPSQTTIQIDSTLNGINKPQLSFGELLNQALSQNRSISMSRTGEAMAAQEINIAKAEKLPTISLYATDVSQRPFLYSIPPQDIYMNFFQGGIRLSYNISSLYHAKEHINLARMQSTKQKKQTALIKEQTELLVHEAYIKWQEAKKNHAALEKSYQLANSNYTIVENKYYNQFAVLTDILDASTAKLDAALQLDNSQATILFRWYQLQKALGKL